MLVDLLALVLVLVAIGLTPVVMMAVLFGLVDYLSDEEKLEEVRQANREGRPVDFSGVDAINDQPIGSGQATADIATSDDGTESRCPTCGERNDGEFERCWNCQTEL
jgi:hypothetical protein